MENSKIIINKDEYITNLDKVTMNSVLSYIYDMKIFRGRFKEIYNENKYNFPINDNRLNNIILSWKKSSNKFNKNTIFENEVDCEGKRMLRECKLFYQHEHKKQNW